MRGWVALGLALFFSLAGCGDEPAGPSELPLDLPVVGTVGDLPAEASRLTIVVTRDGYLRLPGREAPVSFEALQAWLRERAAAGPTEVDGNSALEVLLWIDATTPWVVTQWLMQACANPAVRIYRIALGARTADGARGSLGTTLPRDRSGPSNGTGTTRRIKVYQRQDERGPSGMRELRSALLRSRDAAGRDAEILYEIVAPPPKGGRVPHGTVVQMVDVCLDVGAEFLVFEGAAPPADADMAIWTDPQALKRYIDDLRAQGGVPQIRIDRDQTLLPPDAEDAGPIPGQGRVAGRRGSTTAPLPWLPEIVRERRAGGAFAVRGGAGSKGTAEEAYADRAAQGVEGGLRWLAAHQADSGGWEAASYHAWCDGKRRPTTGRRADLGKSDHDVGVTGLALQAFLAAGYTHRGKHPYARIVSKGLRYLKNVQDPVGCIGPRSTPQYIYGHAVGALALLEAYGMTGSPIFKGAAQRALDFAAIARNPYFAWRYGIKPGDNDTSVTSWMCLLLEVAERINADARERGKTAPLTIDAAAWPGARAWFGKMTADETGRVGYIGRGQGPARKQEMLDAFPAHESEALTAAVCALRLFRGERPDMQEDLRKGLALVAALPPVWSEQAKGRRDLYFWHWGSLAAFRAGAEAWTAWRDALLAAATQAQRADGDACGVLGSWDPIGPWGSDGGRVYSTALMTLCLCTHHRY